MDQSVLESIKIEARENQAPYFTDEEIEYYYGKNDSDFDSTVHELLLIKAEDSTISVSGLTTQDTAGYFRRLASRYRKFNSGPLMGS